MVTANQVGTVYGLAYQRMSSRLYAAAFMKRHTGFGPGGGGAVYVVTPTTGAASVYANLDTIFGAGTTGPNLHDTTNYTRDYVTVGGVVTNTWDATGKTAFGA